jgi:hypothetical protein
MLDRLNTSAKAGKPEKCGTGGTHPPQNALASTRAATTEAVLFQVLFLLAISLYSIQAQSSFFWFRAPRPNIIDFTSFVFEKTMGNDIYAWARFSNRCGEKREGGGSVPEYANLRTFNSDYILENVIERCRYCANLTKSSDLGLPNFLHLNLVIIGE